MKNVLTAITAFCLTFGYVESTSNDVEVQRLEFPEFRIRPNIQYMEFDSVFIKGSHVKAKSVNGVIINDRAFLCQAWPTKCRAK